MKIYLKTILASLALSFTSVSPAHADIPPDWVYTGPSLGELRAVINSTAEATLNPGGSETRRNCRRNSHCQVLNYINDCAQVTFSTFGARGAESAISDLAILHDAAGYGYFDTVCPPKNIIGSCVEKRCTFEENVELKLISK